LASAPDAVSQFEDPMWQFVVPFDLADPYAEVLAQEVGICGALPQERIVRTGARSVQLDDLAEEIEEVLVGQPRSEEEERSTPEELGKRATEGLG
jgi:hypothetical protein